MEVVGSMNVDAVNLTFTWNFSRFKLHEQKTGVSIRSESFIVGVHDMQWGMSMYPKGVDDNSKDHVSLFTYLRKSKTLPINATISYFILNSERKKCNKYSVTNTFAKPSDGVGTYEFILTNDLIGKKYMIDNRFTIICEISVHLSQTQILNEETLSTIQTCANNLSKDLNKLIDNSASTDVSLTVHGQVFRAHKCILSARSLVFAALFQHDMRENRENSVCIEETEADVFKEMLRFIYTAKVENLDKLAFELLPLSDKYGLQDLKELCALHLNANLDIDNAIDIYLLSDRHNSNKLKTETFNFITSNIKFIIDTSKFKTLENTNPSLVAEILRALVAKNIL